MVAKPRDKALNLPVDLHACGHQLWVATKRTRLWINAAEMSFFRWVAWCSPSGEGEELGHSGRMGCRAAAPPHRQEPADVARKSVCNGLLFR